MQSTLSVTILNQSWGILKQSWGFLDKKYTEERTKETFFLEKERNSYFKYL